MPIVVRCQCGTTLRARDEQAGRSCKCPKCGAQLAVPYPVAKAVDPPPPQPPHRQSHPVIPPGTPAVTAALMMHRAGARAGKPTEPTSPPPPPVTVELSDAQLCDRTFRGHIYWVLLLFVIPLVYSTFTGDLDFKIIRDKLLQQQHAHATTDPSDPNYVDPSEKFEEDLKVLPDIDKILEHVPGHRLEGALFARDSWGHWTFAVLAALIFFGVIALAIPCEDLNLGQLFLSGLFTGTVGVALLLTFQEFHMCFCCIGVWYVAALHPSAPFGPSLLGFILGVGISEEITKCIPVLWRIHRQDIGWREACLIGMASGAGFGIFEGIYYCTNVYNGLFPMSIYLVRFVSTCGLHVMLSGACGIMIFRKQKHLSEWYDPYDWVLTISALMIVPIVLHGLFDALLKVEQPAAALGVWVASFAWLAYMIRISRKDELKRLEVTAVAASKIQRTERGTRYIGPEPLP